MHLRAQSRCTRAFTHEQNLKCADSFSFAYFYPIAVALCMRHSLWLWPMWRLCSICDDVGSVTHNELGGWYAYRASKAATNMLVKTIAIEARTRLPNWRVVALHPGTVQSALSEPFTRYRFHALTLSHTHTYSDTHTLAHALTHSLTQSLSLSHTHTHTQAHTHAHSLMQARTHSCTYSLMHALTDSLTRSRTPPPL